MPDAVGTIRQNDQGAEQVRQGLTRGQGDRQTANAESGQQRDHVRPHALDALDQYPRASGIWLRSSAMVARSTSWPAILSTSFASSLVIAGGVALSAVLASMTSTYARLTLSRKPSNFSGFVRVCQEAAQGVSWTRGIRWAQRLRIEIVIHLLGGNREHEQRRDEQEARYPQKGPRGASPRIQMN